MKSIFVSSTFKDMHEERDILHKRVIPELNEYATQYGESVSLCDLRWGVNTEDLDSEEGSRKVLSVCLDEIDRCRPYMIVLLGERYGWIPEPETLREIEKTRAGMNLEDLEKSVTALEIEYGALGNKEQLEHTLFYFREFEGTVPEKYGREDTLHERKLSQLKKRIRNLAGDRVRTYIVTWDTERNTLKGLEHFAEQMTADLKELLEEEWKEYALLTPFERDQRLQWDFARQKSVQFRAREGLIDQYLNKLNQGQNLLAISGASGSGKSTLIGRLAVRLQEEGKEVLPIFCGSTMFCNDAMDVIRYIVRYIEDCFSLEHYEIKKSREVEGLLFEDETGYRGNKTDADRWKERLTDMCALYTEKSDKELVILIDALDQLFPDEIRERLRFIPANLTSKVKMVCSSLDNFDTGYHKKWEQAEELLPLDETDKKAVIDGILHSQGRELSFPVIEKIMTKKGSDNPLYLSLVVQRLAMMDQEDFEKIIATGDGMDAITEYQIAVMDRLPENLEDLCMDLVQAASEKLDNNMAELAVRYIAVSRYGLRETDLEGIFANQGIEWSSLGFTLFFQYMNDFALLRDDGRWDFVHQCFRQGIINRTINLKELHRRILEQLIQLEPKDNVRKEEIIYHCYGADDRAFFVAYIDKYKCNEEIIGSVLEVIHEIIRKEGSQWLCEVIKEGNIYGATYNFIELFIDGFDDNLMTLKEFESYKSILESILLLLEKMPIDVSNLFDQLLTYLRLVSVLYRIGSNLQDKRARLFNISLSNELSKKIIELSKKIEKIIMPSDPSLALIILCHGYTVCLPEDSELVSLLDLIIECAETKKVEAQKFGTIFRLIDKICCQKGGKAREVHMHVVVEELEKKLSKDGGTKERLERLSDVYKWLGESYFEEGGKENQEKACEMYEKSLEMAKELVKGGNTPENLEKLSRAYSDLGNSYQTEGGEENQKKACKMYEKSLEIAKELVKVNNTPENLEKLSHAYTNLGNSYQGRREKENQTKACEIYRCALKVAKEQKEPKSLEELSYIYERLGDNYCKESREIACEMYEKSLMLIKEWVKKDRTALSASSLEVISYKLLEIYLEEAKENQKKACKMYKKSLEVEKELVKENRTPKRLKVLSQTYSILGDEYQMKGGTENQKKACEMYEKSLEIAKELVKEDRTPEGLLEISCIYDSLGKSYREAGGRENLIKACEMYGRSLETAQEGIKDNQTPFISQWLEYTYLDLGSTYFLLGDIYCKNGGKVNLRKGREIYKKGLESVKEYIEKINRTQRSLWLISILYRRLGDSYYVEGGKENLDKSRKMYNISLEVSKKIVKEDHSPESLRELQLIYDRLRMSYEKEGGKENQKKIQEMCEKIKKIGKELERGERE